MENPNLYEYICAFFFPTFTLKKYNNIRGIILWHLDKHLQYKTEMHKNCVFKIENI